jgi:hypothetical protein
MTMTLLAAAVEAHRLTAWGQFVAIISKPDNMPVAGALILVMVFTWVSLRQARINDRLIRENKKDQILEEMQK